MPPTLTIFDCDGVLVDSEAIVCRICVPCLVGAGVTMSADEIADRYIGISARSMIADLETRCGFTLPENLYETMRHRIAAAFETEKLTIDGIDTIIAAHDGAICVASGSSPGRVRRCLQLVGLLHYFDPHIFSATQVARGKPAPDLFLFAAGMRVLGFTGGSHCRSGHAERLLAAGASATFQHMRELPALI